MLGLLLFCVIKHFIPRARVCEMTLWVGRHPGSGVKPIAREGRQPARPGLVQTALQQVVSRKVVTAKHTRTTRLGVKTKRILVFRFGPKRSWGAHRGCRPRRVVGEGVALGFALAVVVIIYLINIKFRPDLY